MTNEQKCILSGNFERDPKAYDDQLSSKDCVYFHDSYTAHLFATDLEFREFILEDLDHQETQHESEEEI